MKTIKSISLLAAFAGIVMAGCANEDIVESNNTSSDNEISIEAYSGNDVQTRLGYTDDGTSITIKWATGDAFKIIPTKSGSSPRDFTLSSGAGTALGVFTGIEPDVDATGYTVLYPSTLSDPAAFDAFSYSEQIQEGNDNTSHLTTFHAIKLAVNSADITSINFGGSGVAQSSLLVLNLNDLPASVGTPQSVAISAEEACLGVTNHSMGTDVSLGLHGFSAISSTDRNIKVYLMLGVNGDNATLPAGKKLTVTLVGTEGSCKANFKSPAAGLCFAGGKRNSITASKWEVEEVPFLFDLTQGWAINDGTFEPIAGEGVKFTSTSAKYYNRCNPYMKDINPAVSLPRDKVLYYQAKAFKGSEISLSNAKISIFINEVMNINGVEGTVTIVQYKANAVGTDKDQYQWFAFDLSQLGADENHQPDIKFRPTNGTEAVYKPTNTDMYNALVTAIKGTNFTFKRIDFILMSNLSVTTEFESFLVKELGVASLATVQNRMNK